ncbi:metal-dependent transcriptional regulator [Ruania alkalisoli]|uniref:Metal-dependent transcriptional regulator n=1 Tax=Ruania alkalisoli TaxID=2779775 RepID=A0A7M1SXS0_9MICO|nr:metal-dependent transcriptional regulator [Ruania alkalisoli]QOR71522.1 metal-dependent transcriptional regulator [Ruania alkalisoli]
MSDLIDTTEMYLKTVYELIEEGIVPLRARIAERLGHSGPTVSQTVARLERDGLMVVTGDRHLELTDEGMARATRVMRKHRLAERLLTDVIGLDWPHVHEEACRWEHVMSRQVEERLIALLDHPGFDPYGNPIPGLEEFGEARPEAELGTWLTDVPAGAEYVITRLGEPLQVDTEMLAELEKAGVGPGVQVSVERERGLVTLARNGSDVVLELGEDVAKHVFVRPV